MNRDQQITRLTKLYLTVPTAFCTRNATKESLNLLYAMNVAEHFYQNGVRCVEDDAIIEGVEYANDCGIPVPLEDMKAYEAAIRRREKKGMDDGAKSICHFLIDHAEGDSIPISELPDLLSKFRRECIEDA